MPGARQILRPWTHQPQEVVRPSEWARSRGLGSLLLPSLGLRDLQDGGTWTPWGTAPVGGVGPHGVGVDATAAFGGLMLLPRVTQATPAQTHIILVQTTGSSGAYAGLVGTAKADGSQASLFVQRQGTDAGWDIWSSSTSIPWSSPTSASIGPSLIVVTGDASGTTAYVDGVVAMSSISVAPAAFSDSRLVLFGERGASAAYSIKGTLYVYAHLTQRLSADEVAGLSVTSIWRHLLAPQRIAVPKASAAPAVPDITAVYADSVTTSSVTPRVTLDFA